MAKKTPVYVNDKYFSNMREAAKVLGCSASRLPTLLKNRTVAFYKGNTIIKATTPLTIPVAKKQTHSREPIPVIVDGVAYNSCHEAERAFNLANGSISCALKAGSKVCKGHKIELVAPSMRSRLGCKVYCKQKDKTYKSISDAAKDAGVDDWTMSKKMEFAGGFIDKNGNEYKRTVPMNTNKVYSTKGKTVREYIAVDKDIKTGDAVKLVKQDVPQIVKDAITDKIIKILKDSGIYDQIIDLLNFGGFSTLKLKND